MRRFGVTSTIAAASFLAALAFTTGSPAQTTHRAYCHTRHTCPSDHATYRWYGRATNGRRARWLCVKPTSPKRNPTFRVKVRYAGLTYWCKR